ncbi:MAG: hypothetical protein MJ203_00720 [archaeon]|nr:hypothetical protein [archaeon]
MKSITIILLAAIAIIGAIAIIITKLYYKDKENDEKIDFDKELGINRSYYGNSAPRNRRNDSRRIRKEPRSPQQDAQRQRELAAFSQSIPSAGNSEDIFNDYYGEPIDPKFVNRQSRKPTPNTPRPQTNNNPRVNNTPKTEEINKIINEPKSNDVEKIASKISQDPMTSEQKEFIKEQKKGKLVIDNTGGSGIKVIKSNDSNSDNPEKSETKFGEIKRVNLSGTPVVSTEEKSDKQDIENIDPKELEKTLQNLMKDSNIENTPLIQEIRDELSSDKSNEVKTEEKVEEEIKTEFEEGENTDNSYIGKLPIFKKDKPKTGETTLDDHHPQGYVENIPNTDSLESKEEDEVEAVDEYGVITPIYNDKNVSGAVETVENLRSNLNTEDEEDYEDDFISITPLTEEEIREEFKEESATINPIQESSESEALKEFKNNIDETAKEKAEAKEELRKLREENTEKLFKVSKENKESLNSISQNGSSVKHKVETINTPEVKEEIVIDGEIYEVSKGMSIMFVHNNETYSSAILALKPGFVGVKYRGRNVWVKHSRIKKVFK